MTSLLESRTVCAAVSSAIALVRLSSSTECSANHSLPPRTTSSRAFSPPRYPLDTAVRSYGGSGSRETRRIEPSTPASRRVCAQEKPAAPPPTMRKSTERSGTGELRLPFLRERAEALARVRGLEQLRDPLALAGQAVGDLPVDAGVRGELDLADGHGRPVGQRLRVGARVP